MDEEILNENIIEYNEENSDIPIEENIVQSYEDFDNVVSDQEIITEENIQNEQTDNDLLMEYIKSQLLEEQLNEVQRNDENVSDSSNDDSNNVIDYQSLIDSIDLLYQEQLNTNMDIETYLEDNTMQSNVEDISLTNQLLIVVFLGILFTALLNFSRRIF